SSPVNGAAFHEGDVIPAAYSCTAGVGTTVKSCAGPVASGATVDTTTPGAHSFTVTVTDQDGGSATSVVNYTVTTTDSGGGGRGPVVRSVSAATQTHDTWTERRRAKKHGGPPVGTSFDFNLDEAGQVIITFRRSVAGRRVNGACVAPAKSNHDRPRCSRLV